MRTAYQIQHSLENTECKEHSKTSEIFRTNLMKININIIKTVLANKIQQCIKRILYHNQRDFF